MTDRIPHIFIAYARRDKAALTELSTHLQFLQRRKMCTIFYDGEIKPGERWDKRLKDELHKATIFVLLVSADFLNSDYVNDVELPKILNKEKQGTAKVLPVILKKCLWKYSEISELQVIMDGGKPIGQTGGFGEAADAIANVVTEYNQAIKDELAVTELKKKQAEEQKRKTEQEKKERLQKEKERKKRKAEEAARRRAADPFHDLMVPIKGGTFQMGDEHGDLWKKWKDCRPLHPVTVKGFHLCQYPVTQAQWRKVMGSDPPELGFKGCDDCPVESVSWDDVQEFLKKLNAKTGERYRLPSEAEWEFAARGGTKSKGYEYAGSNDVEKVAWYWKNSGDKKLYGDWDLGKILINNCRTHPVSQKAANELGLYDMSGNVWEWCEDVWHGDYKGAPDDGRAWVEGGEKGRRRVVRGGSWIRDVRYCRCAFRYRVNQDIRNDRIGFRLAR
ncbi:MAG TPA: TIR domain-containing protein [Bacteroidetes bacterium]|nr:TIR domain-containing protein [Bacteroidota bacterium]